MKGKKLLLLSLILALVAAGLVFRYLGELDARSRLAADLVPVLVAKAEIPARSRLDETMFSVQQVPKSYRLQDALVKKEDIRGAFAQDRLLPGEQILSSRLVYTESKTGLAYKVSPGHRAVTLAVNTVSGVAGFILPNDHVDVLVTLDLPEGEEDTTLTAVVAGDIRVLAVGQFIYDQKKEQLVADSVTLDVPNDAVARVVQATERGSVRLVLRPVVEEVQVPLPHHTLRQFSIKRP